MESTLTFKQKLILLPLIGLLVSALIFFPFSAANAQSAYSSHGNFEVVKFSNECMLYGSSGDGVILIGLSPGEGTFAIAAAPESDPGITAGDEYEMTIEVDGRTYTWKGTGMEFAGVNMVAGISTDLSGVYNTLTSADVIDIDVSGVHLIKVTLDSNFDASLSSTVQCAKSLVS